MIREKKNTFKAFFKRHNEAKQHDNTEKDAFFSLSSMPVSLIKFIHWFAL